MADGPLVGVDERLSRALVHPDRVGERLSDLGNVQIALPALMAILLYVAVRSRRAGTDRWWWPPTAALVLMALIPALVVPVKELTDRPGTPAVPPATGFFPSGHTATAAIAYGAATLLLLPWLRSTATRRAVVTVCAALVLGVSYGLVRRGFHWPLDVMASWCLSTVLLTGFVLLVSRSSRRRSAGTPSSSSGPS